MSTNQALDDVLQQAEDLVRTLRDAAQQHYSDRCSCSAPGCILNGCFSEVTNSQCALEQFDIGCSDCPGILHNTDDSFVRLAHESTSGLTSEEDINAACWTDKLDADFREVYGSPELASAFYGHWTGLWRQFPGAQFCSNFDPRFRPWYVASQSGPKDVVLVIDVSGSMNQHNRLEIAKGAALAVLDTLSFADHVGVVLFSTTAREISGSSRMRRATREVITELKAKVNALNTEYDTNFEAAFETTFQLLKESKRTEATSNCQTAVLFLTDGEATSGIQQSDLLLARVQTLRDDSGVEPVLFSYSLGNDADTIIPKALACDMKGVWQVVLDGDAGALRTQMSRFYDYFALLNNDDTVRWVEAYEFATTGQLGTTASLMLYSEERVDGHQLPLGVFGVDIYVGELERLSSSSYQDVLDQLKWRSATCTSRDKVFDDCQLEALRAKGDTDSDSLCRDQCTDLTRLIELHPHTCSQPAAADTWCDVVVDEELRSSDCCECSGDGLGVGVIIAIAVGALVMLLAIVCACVKARSSSSPSASRPQAHVPANNMPSAPTNEMSTRGKKPPPYSMG